MVGIKHIQSINIKEHIAPSVVHIRNECYNYGRHNVGSSGLGGYPPRKRKSKDKKYLNKKEALHEGEDYEPYGISGHGFSIVLGVLLRDYIRFIINVGFMVMLSCDFIFHAIVGP